MSALQRGTWVTCPDFKGLGVVLVHDPDMGLWEVSFVDPWGDHDTDYFREAELGLATFQPGESPRPSRGSHE